MPLTGDIHIVLSIGSDNHSIRDKPWEHSPVNAINLNLKNIV